MRDLLQGFMLALLLMVSPAVSMAHWITEGSQQSEHKALVTSLAVSSLAVSKGQQLFNSLGCAECHGGMTRHSYVAGFKVVDDLALPSASESQVVPPSQSKLVLDGSNYQRSTHNSALYLLKLHASGAAAEADLKELNALSASDLEALKAYIILF